MRVSYYGVGGFWNGLKWIGRNISKDFSAESLNGGSFSVLDYGAGYRSLKKHIPGYFKYYPYDIRECKKDGDKNFTTLPDKKFDVIVANHVIEHLNEEERKKFWDYVRERCKIIYIGTPYPNIVSLSRFWDSRQHLHPVSPTALIKDLVENGFKPVKITYCSMYRWPFNILLCLLMRQKPFSEYVVKAEKVSP